VTPAVGRDDYHPYRRAEIHFTAIQALPIYTLVTMVGVKLRKDHTPPNALELVKEALLEEQ